MLVSIVSFLANAFINLSLVSFLSGENGGCACYFPHSAYDQAVHDSCFVTITASGGVYASETMRYSFQ